MAVREPLMLKNWSGVSSGELQTKVGESYLIKGFYVEGVSNGWLTLKIEKTTVGYFRVGDDYTNHLHFPNASKNKSKNLLDLLFEKGIFKGYPVAEGETFSWEVSGGTPSRVAAVYEVADAGDHDRKDENGSMSTTYFFINYGDTGGDINSSGDHLLDNTRNPVEFPAFPFGADVPAKTRITLYGILGSEVAVVDSTPALALYTSFLKMVKERIVLFDEDRNGFPFDYSDVALTAGTHKAGGFSVIGNFDLQDPRLPLFFPEPLVFEAGEELNIYLTVGAGSGSGSIAQDDHVIGLITRVERAE